MMVEMQSEYEIAAVGELWLVLLSVLQGERCSVGEPSELMLLFNSKGEVFKPYCVILFNLEIFWLLPSATKKYI